MIRVKRNQPVPSLFLILGWFAFWGQPVFSQRIPTMWPDADWRLTRDADTTIAQDENGVVRYKAWYSPQSQDSVFLLLNWAGTPECLVNCKRREPLQGCATFYQYSKPTISEISCWYKDEPSDWFTKFYEDGNVAQKGRFEEGEKTGQWKEFYPNGKIMSSGSWILGVKDGIWSYFHADSILAYTELWSDGELKSVSDFHTKEGKLLSGGRATSGNGLVLKYHLSGHRKQKFFLVDGKPQGAFWEYDSLGKTLRLRQFQDGIIEDHLVEFFPDSTPNSSIQFFRGQENGHYYSFHTNGQIAIKGFFKAGKEDSTWHEFDENGRRAAEYQFNQGRLVDWYYEFFDDQSLKAQSFFINGLRDSLFTDWHRKGVKSSEIQYRSGLKTGRATEWYANGKLKSQGNFKNDMEDGLWRIYFENGQLQSQGRYVLGFPDGLWINKFGNGKMASEGNYVNAEEDGTWKFYYPDGKLKSSETWKDGKLLSVDQLLSPKGKKLDGGKLVEGSGFLKTYSLDGLLEGEGPMKNGEPNGRWKYYSPSGKLSAEGDMVTGKRMGIWKFYDANGTQPEEERYLFDRVIP